MANDRKKRTRPIRKEICLNAEEYRVIKERQNSANLKNFGTFARYMMLTGKVVTVDFKELVELRNEVKRIGVNINQMAKYINVSEEVSAEDYRILQEQVQGLKELVANKFASESSYLEELLELQEGGMNSGCDQTLEPD
ncbi:MobC family plasmid mobilization relaxosome protein [Streptococcus gallolyticus]|nr:MobC family plasmid mobilization relaxosome protein [Streptococcus gallolyticus]MBY5041796.1 MobC family plasmid mobilization relaxosome protein [Streptococcus gallolyticus]